MHGTPERKPGEPVLAARARRSLAFALAALACAPTLRAADGDAEALPEAVLQGDRSEVHALTIQRVRTTREWTALWSQLGPRVTRAQPPVPFDFSAGQLLAFLAGDQRSGGVEVSVRGIDVLPDRLALRVHFSYPGPGCVVSTALTQPFQVVRIDRSLPERPIEFRYEFERRACAPGTPPAMVLPAHRN